MQTWMWWAAAGAILLFYFLKPSVPAGAAMNPAELQDWVKSKKDLQLIDVRTPEEYAEGHLAGARLLPLSSLKARMGELDPKRPLVLYCQSGNRSGQGLKLLLGSGFAEAKHMSGGISAWQGAGLPVAR